MNGRNNVTPILFRSSYKYGTCSFLISNKNHKKIHKCPPSPRLALLLGDGVVLVAGSTTTPFVNVVSFLQVMHRNSIPILMWSSLLGDGVDWGLGRGVAGGNGRHRSWYPHVYRVLSSVGSSFCPQSSAQFYDIWWQPMVLWWLSCSWIVRVNRSLRRCIWLSSLHKVTRVVPMTELLVKGHVFWWDIGFAKPFWWYWQNTSNWWNEIRSWEMCVQCCLASIRSSNNANDTRWLA